MFIIQNDRTKFQMKEGYITKAGNTLCGYYYKDDGKELTVVQHCYIKRNLMLVFHINHIKNRKDSRFYFAFHAEDSTAEGLNLSNRLKFKNIIEEQELELELSEFFYL